MSRVATAAAVGALFGAGLAAGGMTDPRVVLGFLDLTGAWDPRLLAVMAGALAVTVVGFRLAQHRGRPFFAAAFRLPTARALDARLIGGAALFGIGWGVAGYCPGPALAALAINPAEAIVFLPAMVAGSWLGKLSVP
jgi:uncharacterized membrane protein YedE/YeeE